MLRAVLVRGVLRGVLVLIDPSRRKRFDKLGKGLPHLGWIPPLRQISEHRRQRYLPLVESVLGGQLRRTGRTLAVQFDPRSLLGVEVKVRTVEPFVHRRRIKR
ncbi:MAG: hypothetical protein IIB99_04020 [Planctomycetes bacterium]|nr:hypothetical protein [Planctomycetota bacterium]